MPFWQTAVTSSWSCLVAEHEDLARARRHLAGEHLEERAFTRAVRPDQAADFAFVHDEVDVVIGDDAAIALAERRASRWRSCRRSAGARSARSARLPAVPPISAIGASGCRPERSRCQRSVDAADDAAAQEHDQHHEHEAKDELPRRAQRQRRLQFVAQIQPERAAHQRPDQRAGAADHGLHHQLARGVEGEGLWRHVALQRAFEPSGEPRIGRRDDEDRELVALDVVADRLGAHRVVADRRQHMPEGRGDDAARDDEADKEDHGQQAVERPRVGEGVARSRPG